MAAQAIKIALLGSLPKGDSVRQNWVDWKPTYIQAIKVLLPDVEFIHGDDISDNAGAELVVGHDLTQIRRASICVVNAETKVGAGTAQEIVIAKYFGKPLISVIPSDTHHRKTNITFHGVIMDEWIHPFLKLSSDYVAESIEDAAAWLQKFVEAPQKYQIKDVSVYEQAIEKFEAWEKQ